MIAKAWDQTSDEVRAWLTERSQRAAAGNPWAEEQLKAFLRAFQKFDSGVKAYRYLVGGEHEQLRMDVPESGSSNV